MKAIPTLYKGYQMRSRLEARWACFFDALRLKWEYEPEGFDLGTNGWYLPDFWVDDMGSMGSYVEIKPRRIGGFEDAVMRCRGLARQSGRPVILIAGQPWSGEYRVMFIADHARGWLVARSFGIGRSCGHLYLTDIEAHSAARKDFIGMRLCPGGADCAMASSSDLRIESAYLAGRQLKGFGAA